MNRIQHIICCASVALAATAYQPVSAQINLAKDTYPVIVAPHNQTVSYRERTLCYEITASVPFEVATTADWVSVRKTEDGTVYVHLKENKQEAPRTAEVQFKNAENNLVETLTLTQGRYEIINEMTQDTRVIVASASDNGHQASDDVQKTLDNDLGSIYHTPWSGFVVSETNPAILTYNFKDVAHIDYLEYVSRQKGGSNGNFGKVEVLAKCGTETTYKSIVKVDLKGAGGTSRIDLGQAGLDNPKSIQVKVTSGANNNASCAEMRFFVDNRKDLFGLFADPALTSLKKGTTQEDINKIADPMVADLAQKLFDGSYKKDYRVAKYGAKLSVQVQSEIFGTPGKFYDQSHGVTGINIRKGKHAVAVSGLPEGETLPLRVTAWYEGKISGNFDGGNPIDFDYTLKNGFNVIDYPFNYDGLAYVRYYADTNPQLRDSITVHFINGEVNGYLSLDKTNEEMDALLQNAPNLCMDVYGNNVHSVWTSRGVKDPISGRQLSQGLYGNCKSTEDTKGYRQFLHMLDSLLIWEHELLGFHKYNHTPDNRTTAYANFTYYMFQGGRGVSFHVDQEPRVLNCKRMIYDDDDAIWGLSHEWGHLHQMNPYFCWAGMAEVTNNMNSYYNVMRMGHVKSDKINAWPIARKHFVDGYYGSFGYHTVYYDRATGQIKQNPNEQIAQSLKLVSEQRRLAYNHRNEVQYNAEYYRLATAMADSTIRQVKVNDKLALSINEVGVGETLCPLIMLYNYFSRGDAKYNLAAKKDFAPDWYEALRQNDDPKGSQVEKKGEADKYELIASVQNGNKNNKYPELKQRFPESVWIKKNLVTANSTMWQNSAPYIFNYIRKVSRLSGYNLMPYFERWGFLRQIAMRIGDYGNKWTLITPEMYDEFKADMDQLVKDGELKTMPEGMVESISNSPDWFQKTPVFPN